MRNTFLRLLLFNIVLVSITTVLPALSYFQYFQKHYNEQISRNYLQSVINFGKTVDDKIMKDFIRIPDLYITARLSNETLVFPFRNDINGDTKRILQISNRLKEIKNSYPYIDSIDIYYRSNNMLFINSNVCFLDTEDCVTGPQKKWLDLFNKSEHSYRWMHTVTEPSKHKILTYARSIPYYSSVKYRLGVVAVNVDERKVRELMMEQSNAFKGHHLWLVDEFGNLISKNGEDSRNVVPGAVIDALLKQDESTGVFSAKIEGEPSVISFVKSQYNSWYYISVASVNDFYKKSSDLLKIIVLMGGVMLLVNVVFALMITRRAHKPIGKMFHQYTSQIEEMKSRWDRSKIIIRHDYLLKLLKGQLDTDTNLEENEHLLEFDFDRRYCLSFVILLDIPAMSFKAEQLLMYQIIEELELEEGNKPASVYAVNLDRKKIAGVITVSHENIQGVVQDVEYILKRHSIGSYTFAAGSVFPCNASGISLSYKEAEEALDYRFLYNQRVIMYPSLQIENRNKNNLSITLLIEELGEAIGAGHGTRLKQIVRNITVELEKNLYTVTYCREVLSGILSKLQQEIPRLGIQLGELAEYDLRDYSKNIESLHLFGAWLNHLIDTLIVRIEENKKTSEIPMDVRIKKYIHDHMLDNLSLDSISNHFGISPNYFSKMFKSLIGKTFIEYVMDMKMQAAAQMLLTKKWTVEQISDHLGYTSTPHFIRVFKEKYGQTPKQYQRQHTEGRS